MNLFQRAIKALGFNYSGSYQSNNDPFFGNNFALWDQFWSGNGARVDFTKELGDLRTSSLVMSAYEWIARNTASARLEVVQLDSDNKEKEIQGHPLPDLLYTPNPFYGFTELIAGLSYSWLVKSTAYILIVPGQLGQPVQLWYEPHWSIRPVWPPDGSAWVTGYEVERGGIWSPVPIEQVIVLRKGIDVANRCGQSGISALIGELYTEQQASRFTNLLLRNGLVPPVVVGLGSKDNPFTGDPKEVSEQLKRKMSGDSAGEPAVVPGAVTVQKLGFDYNSVGLREVRQVPEERFCSVMGISPYSLHFGTSRTASTFSNVEQYLRYDYRSYIVPFQSYIASVLTRELLPAYGAADNVKVCWNYDEVDLMQADLTVEWKRIIDAYKARILDQAEAREAISYKSDDKHKDVYYPVPAASTADLEPEAPEPQPQLPGRTPMLLAEQAAAKAWFEATDADITAGEDWWRRNAPPEAKDLVKVKPVS